MLFRLTPNKDQCREAFKRNEAIAVSVELTADTETPISLALKLRDSKLLFYLESAENSMERGRFSVIACDSEMSVTLKAGKLTVAGASSEETERLEALAPLEAIRSFIKLNEFAVDPALPPMAAGVFGYLGYACVRLLEPTVPDTNPDILDVPDAFLFRPKVTLIHDRLKDTLILTTVLRPSAQDNLDEAYATAQARLKEIEQLLDQPTPRQFSQICQEATTGAEISQKSCVSKAEYCDAVERAREYILAGDAFQIVLSQRFSRPLNVDGFELYRSVRRTNPSPYMYYLNFGDMEVIGASPETLVRLRDGQITIRPLAGSIRRGTTEEEDLELQAALLVDEKERAEHLMLLDLGRNDVGRAAQIGSVEVPRQFVIERYSHVMHISSTVTGEIAPPHDGLSALLCGFPAGTLSGAPKVRAMQIIDELETERRGLYAGGIGYFGANGDMEICIVLRTGILKEGILHVNAGAGVVADSLAESEYEECRIKARAMFHAAEDAEARRAQSGSNS